MNDFMVNRISSVPIVTGTPVAPSLQTTTAVQSGSSFADMLKAKLAGSSIEFSKHAVNRVIERNIDVSGANLERLNAGVEIAKSKGLNDTLILVDSTAYIVNAQAGKVITTVSEADLKGNVFTNIDGTVII